MDKIEKVMELALRRGFLWPSYEIYGGVSGFYDYGPLGATLKKRLEDKWRGYYCTREGFLEIFSPSVSPEEVFIASGHVKSFVDPMVECTKCKEVYRANELIKEITGVKTDGLSFKELDGLIEEKEVRCPGCNGKLSEVWSYNLMFKTHIGPGSGKIGYLRPETAQGMFLLYNRLYEFYRKTLPFGVAQLGRAYRNEISPRQGVIRLREFNQAEVEIFVNPTEKTHPNFPRVAGVKLALVPHDGKNGLVSAGKAVDKGIIANQLLTYHLVLVRNFLIDVGIPKEKIRFRQHLKTEMAHYAADCWDAEVETKRFSWIEVVGIADRMDYDLKSHKKMSGADLTAFIQYDESKQKVESKFSLDMGVIGPKYKGKAEVILKATASFGSKERDFFIEHGYVEFDVAGKKIRLDKTELTLKEEKKTVTGEKIIPHVIEPSYGIDRIIYCVLESAYSEEGERSYLKLENSLAPVQVAVFPLVSKEALPRVASEIFDNLKKAGLTTTYDEDGSIGRRYARADEIGVPYAVTVDFDSKDKTVTIRERDSTDQVRVKIKKLEKTLTDLLGGNLKFEELL
ncbi:MAG: glycine--tRNA ligase [Candidatus Hydrothermarchaeota archaeon]|nr:glycine--tRNA ligase [Candidatus Hydrothermarchaeota archaeon]